MKRPLTVLLIFTVFLSCTFANTGSASQEPTKIQALNNYVNFLNESIHGMVIVHRLLENYNQELNKYVDLDGYQINKFANKDLPKNIFEDPENWFYSISPLEWNRIAKEASTVLPEEAASSLNNLMAKQKLKLSSINSIRFEIENYILKNDLTQLNHVQEVYKLLEKGVQLYDNFYDDQTKMEVLLVKYSRMYGKPGNEILDVVEAFDKTWFAAKNIVRSVRTKKNESLPGQLSSLSRAIAGMKAIDLGTHPRVSLNSRKPVKSWQQALKKLDQISDQTRALVETAEVPVEYKFYGKFYYYHNAVLVNYINRYGSGFTHEMNKIIKEVDIPMLYRVEEPHFYQVIYPRKLVNDDVIASSDDEILAVPTKLKNREIIKSTRKILVDTMIFDISLYDHKIQDGDIVSINFNGDWILENHSLEGSATNLKVRLNKEGKNYLILHAENEGKRPPNTMAVSYMYNGERQIITLSSNLAESEMIEIQYDSGGK